MSKVVHVLDGRVVAVLVRHKESSLDVTSIGVLALFVKDLLIKVDVVVVDGIVEGDGDHLGNVVTVGSSGSNSAKTAGNLSSVLRAETVGKFADVCVASGSAVRIGVNFCQVKVSKTYLQYSDPNHFYATFYIPKGMLLFQERPLNNCVIFY